MGDSAIQWTTKTWNPLTGCTRVSAGCDHCYAFQLHDMRHIAWKRGRWPKAPQQYHQPFSQVQLFRERLSQPRSWREPAMIFVNSMSDLFHEDVPEDFIDAAFDVMGWSARHHTYQVLTKRPERMAEQVARVVREKFGGQVRENIWLGASVENQDAADARREYLFRTPACTRFLSMEPLLGRVNLDPYLWAKWLDGDTGETGLCVGELERGRLDWVILGGESGKHARLMDLAWMRDIIAQCRAAGVAVFVKQLGSVWARENGAKDRHGGDMAEWPDDLRIRDFPQQPARTGAGGGG